MARLQCILLMILVVAGLVLGPALIVSCMLGHCPIVSCPTHAKVTGVYHGEATVVSLTTKTDNDVPFFPTVLTENTRYFAALRWRDGVFIKEFPFRVNRDFFESVKEGQVFKVMIKEYKHIDPTFQFEGGAR